MKTKLVLVCLLAVLWSGSQAEAAPHLTIKESKFNFGYVPQHSKVTHRFWLYNTGDDTLRITKVIPG